MPKANGNSDHDSDNYRGIALSSMLCVYGYGSHNILSSNRDIVMQVKISFASNLALQRLSVPLQ